MAAENSQAVLSMTGNWLRAGEVEVNKSSKDPFGGMSCVWLGSTIMTVKKQDKGRAEKLNQNKGTLAKDMDIRATKVRSFPKLLA